MRASRWRYHGSNKIIVAEVLCSLLLSHENRSGCYPHGVAMPHDMASPTGGRWCRPQLLLTWLLIFRTTAEDLPRWSYYSSQ